MGTYALHQVLSRYSHGNMLIVPFKGVYLTGLVIYGIFHLFPLNFTY
jgi:hypothetical protein